MTRPTKTQLAILRNIENGRRWDLGRPLGWSAAGGWDRSFMSCLRRGWVRANVASGDYLTAEGLKVLESNL